MRVGIQFRGNLPPNAKRRWFTHSWPADWHVIWHAAPTSPRSGAPQVEWEVEVERANDRHITYWITVKNLISTSVDFEMRYAVLN